MREKERRGEIRAITKAGTEEVSGCTMGMVWSLPVSQHAHYQSLTAEPARRLAEAGNRPGGGGGDWGVVDGRGFCLNPTHTCPAPISTPPPQSLPFFLCCSSSPVLPSLPLFSLSTSFIFFPSAYFLIPQTLYSEACTAK